MALQTAKVYSDVDISFLPHPITKDVLKKTGAAAVAQSIVNLILLSHYEKPFHPEIGSNIRKLLFELGDNVTASLIAEEVKIAIGNFEPRATILGVYVDQTSDGYGYNVTIEFSVITLPDPVSITVFLDRVR
jgi:phage baseplate assembly protein W